MKSLAVKDKKPHPHGSTALIYAMFFFSGMASLICEIVWFKQLQLILGSSTSAVSIVVACFFVGLSLGSWIVGWLGDRWTQLLRAYAVLELGLGVASSLLSFTLSRWDQWVGLLTPYMSLESSSQVLVMIAVSTLLLLTPTTLMGATLPVLTKHLVREQSTLAGHIGMLYAINTLGAALGCLLVGFILIAILGVLNTALLASCVYVGIAVTAMWLYLATRRRPLPPSTTEHLTKTKALSSRSIQWLLVVVFLSGFTSIAYEVLWFRTLTFFTYRTVYAFSTMLFVFLIGLVIGSYFTTRLLASKKRHLLELLTNLQLTIPITVLVSFAILGRSRNFLAIFSSLIGVAENNDPLLGIFMRDDILIFVLSFMTMIIPTTLIGMCFPIAAALVVPTIQRVSSSVGTFYSLNTLGGVLGSLAAGFLLLPRLGSQWSFVTVIGLNLLAFAVLMISQESLPNKKKFQRRGCLVAVSLAAMLFFMGSDYLRVAQTKYTDAEVLDFHEDADATFVVLGYDLPHASFQQLVINGASYANNRPEGRRYMAALGHLPALLHPDPKTVGVIAIGTGTTVGSLTLHPEIEEIWAVDLFEHVFEIEHSFRPLNHSFLDSPKVKKIVADGRHFLHITENKFDVLTFEPPPPVESGVVNLYSREFYRLAKQRLNDNGILCQWIPLHFDREILIRMLSKTLLDEFPHVSLWIPNHQEAVVIAASNPLKIDERDLLRRMSYPPLKKDMTEYGLGSPQQLLATFMTADSALEEYVGEIPSITDDKPRVEHFHIYPLKRFSFSDILPYRTPINRYLTQPPMDQQQLERSKQVMEIIWSCGKTETMKDRQASREKINKGLSLQPENQYLLYLLKELDYLDERDQSL